MTISGAAIITLPNGKVRTIKLCNASRCKQYNIPNANAQNVLNLKNLHNPDFLANMLGAIPNNSSRVKNNNTKNGKLENATSRLLAPVKTPEQKRSWTRWLSAKGAFKVIGIAAILYMLSKYGVVSTVAGFSEKHSLAFLSSFGKGVLSVPRWVREHGTRFGVWLSVLDPTRLLQMTTKLIDASSIRQSVKDVCSNILEAPLSKTYVINFARSLYGNKTLTSEEKGALTTAVSTKIHVLQQLMGKAKTAANTQKYANAVAKLQNVMSKLIQ